MVDGGWRIVDVKQRRQFFLDVAEKKPSSAKVISLHPPFTIRHSPSNILDAGYRIHLFYVNSVPTVSHRYESPEM